MAEDNEPTGRDRRPERPPTVAGMVDISVRMVGDSAATSADGNWDEAEATLASAFTGQPRPRGRPDRATGKDVTGPERTGSGTAAERELLARRRIELFAAHCADDRYGDAAVVGEEIVEYHRRYYGGYHYRTVSWTGRLGEAYLRDGDPGRAVPLIDAAVTALESLRGGDDPETRHYRQLHAAARAGQRRPDPFEDAP